MDTNNTTPVAAPKERESFSVPVAIVIAAALIAGAIYITGNNPKQAAVQKEAAAAAADANTTFRAVDSTDHIRGNPNAPIVLVEYSDFDCPFCKQFDDTLQQIMKDYGTSGKVAWVYRQLPLQQLHPNAPKIAIASECVAQLGGNNAFWKFSDRIFKEKTDRTFTDMSRISEYAVGAGVEKAVFEDCYNNNKTKDKVDKSITEAFAAGARGTPHTFILVGDQRTVINGAQPYPVVKQIIDNVLAQIEGKATTTPKN
jgi:protein-disulfide isomerase